MDLDTYSESSSELNEPNQSNNKLTNNNQCINEPLNEEQSVNDRTDGDQFTQNSAKIELRLTKTCSTGETHQKTLLLENNSECIIQTLVPIFLLRAKALQTLSDELEQVAPHIQNLHLSTSTTCLDWCLIRFRKLLKLEGLLLVKFALDIWNMNFFNRECEQQFEQALDTLISFKLYANKQEGGLYSDLNKSLITLSEDST